MRDSKYQGKYYSFLFSMRSSESINISCRLPFSFPGATKNRKEMWRKNRILPNIMWNVLLKYSHHFKWNLGIFLSNSQSSLFSKSVSPILPLSFISIDRLRVGSFDTIIDVDNDRRQGREEVERYQHPFDCSLISLIEGINQAEINSTGFVSPLKIF